MKPMLDGTVDHLARYMLGESGNLTEDTLVVVVRKLHGYSAYIAHNRDIRTLNIPFRTETLGPDTLL